MLCHHGLHNIHLSVHQDDWIHNQNIRLIRNPNSNREPEVDDWIHNQNILLVIVEFVCWSNHNPGHNLKITKKTEENITVTFDFSCLFLFPVI